jgi:hypothetical protein
MVVKIKQKHGGWEFLKCLRSQNKFDRKIWGKKRMKMVMVEQPNNMSKID